jgi:hypothetical protein
MRLIHTFHKSSGITARVFFSVHESSGITAGVFFSEECKEFTVRFYDGKEHVVNMDYFTDNREDALYTARIQLSEMDMITE